MPHLPLNTRTATRPEQRSATTGPHWGAAVISLLFAVSILSLAVRAPAQTPVKVYLDMEAGTNGNPVTIPILNAATHSTNGSWSLVPNRPTALFITNAFDQPLGGPVSVAGTNYTDRGSTRSIAVLLNTPDNPQYAARWFTPQPPPWDMSPSETRGRVSVGCYVRLGVTPNDGNTYDLIHLDGAGEFGTLNFRDEPGSLMAFRAHTFYNFGSVGQNITITSNKTYWVTMLWDRNDGANGHQRLRVYDPVTWKLVGGMESELEHLTAGDVSEVRFGRVDAHAGNPASWVYFDDLMIDDQGLQWPLMPGTNAAPQEFRLTSITRDIVGVKITWAGGTGPFQIQIRSSMNSGTWTNWGGPVTGNSAAVPTSKVGYLRVIGH